MKKYNCDGGCIMIGTVESRTCFPNGYGDGCHNVSVIKTEEQKKKFKENNKNDDWTWLGTVEGIKFHVWDYDCLSDDELTEENILYTLSGRYAVYRKQGNITLEKRG